MAGHDIPSSTLLGAFSAKDGHLVSAAQADDAWKRFAQAISNQAFANDTRFHNAAGRNQHRLEILSIVKSWVSERAVSAVLTILGKADVPAAKIQNIAEVLVDPQIQARNMLVEQNHPILGKIKLPNLSFNFSEYTIDQTQSAPLMGQHNVEIAKELKFSDAEIAAMQQEGVLYAEKI